MLKSFQQRLNASLTSQDATQKSALAVLPQLSVILEESNHLSLQQAAVTSVDLVAGRFGKQGLASTFATAKVVAGAGILGAGDRILQIAALLCLATMAGVLKEMFTPLVPPVLPISLEYLGQSFQEGMADGRLHNASYSFLKALLSNTPWIFTDTYLEKLLSASSMSANSGLGKECDHIRVNTLEILAKQVDPQLCFTALDRTWEMAMKNGLIVS